MAKNNRTTLKTYFETGDIPTQQEFTNLIDSNVNNTQSEDETITKADTKTFQVVSDPGATNRQKLILSDSELFVDFYAATQDFYASMGFEGSGAAVGTGGGMYMIAHDLTGDIVSAFSLNADGIIKLGDLTGDRWSHIQVTSDNSARINALDPAVKELVIPHIKWLIDNFDASVEKLTAFTDTDIIVNTTRSYSTIKAITAATHTITANVTPSNHIEGKYLTARYSFSQDCTLTLVNFDTEGNATGTINPIPTGTYDFYFIAGAFGVWLGIKNNASSTTPTGDPPLLLNAYVDSATPNDWVLIFDQAVNYTTGITLNLDVTPANVTGVVGSGTDTLTLTTTETVATNDNTNFDYSQISGDLIGVSTGVEFASTLNEIIAGLSARDSIALMPSLPSRLHQIEMSRFIITLEQASLWADIREFRSYALDIEANKLIGWKGNYNAINNGGLAIADQSFEFDGVSDYLDSGINLNTDSVAVDDCLVGSYILVNTNGAGNDGYPFGARELAGARTRTSIGQSAVSDLRVTINDANSQAMTVIGRTHFLDEKWYFGQTILGTYAIYENDTLVQELASTTSPAKPNINLYENAMNEEGTGAILHLGGKHSGFVLAKESTFNKSIFSTAFNTYLINLGAK